MYFLHNEQVNFSQCESYFLTCESTLESLPSHDQLLIDELFRIKVCRLGLYTTHEQHNKADALINEIESLLNKQSISSVTHLIQYYYFTGSHYARNNDSENAITTLKTALNHLSEIKEDHQPENLLIQKIKDMLHGIHSQCYNPRLFTTPSSTPTSLAEKPSL